MSDHRNRFHEPLAPRDSESQTEGCRHTASQCCARNSLAKVCAFVRGDKICVAPPMSWAKQYRALKILETTANGT